MITFDKTWSVNGEPADATSVTLGVYDNTTGTQVVPDGTSMTHAGTGQYTYTFATPTAGHTYTATFVVTYNSLTNSSSVITIYSPATPSAGPPVTSSAAMVATLQQQLADVTAAKTAALRAIAVTLAAGLGPTYTISGRAGSESFDYAGFLRMLTDQVKTFIELERLLMELLQELQPFFVVQHLHVGGRLW